MVVSEACPRFIEPKPIAVDVVDTIPDTGRPVQLVRIPDVGVPSEGVISMGETKFAFSAKSVLSASVPFLSCRV